MDITQVHAWVDEASAIARKYFNVVEARVKADRSVVTAADDEIEALLRQRILAAYPDHTIVGEEHGGAETDAEYLWAIDPLDGTSVFVQGLPIWGISVGLMHRGEPILGCFHLPLLDEWYEAGIEGPATFNGRSISVTSEDLFHPEAWVTVPSNAHRSYRIDYPRNTRSTGSAAANICYVARGSATGAILGRAHVWDIAGGLAILRRAGGDIQQLYSGEPVNLAAMGRALASEPLIAGSPAAIAMLRERVQEVRDK